MENDLEKLFDNDLTPPTPKEEIIIDGVDVAGCEYYKGKCMEYTHYCQIGCKECTDIGTKLCHYKQTERFKAKIARLEQENKELKENLLDKYSPRYYDIVPKRQTVELYKKFDDLRNQNNTYRSALEEIKNKAENYEIIMRKTDLYEDDCNNCPKSALKEIISMINEVLNEN